MAKLEVAMERTPRTARQVLILTDTGLDYDQWWRHLRFYHVLDSCEPVCRLHQVRWNKFKLNFGSFWKFLFLWAVTVSMVIPSLWRLSSISSLKFRTNSETSILEHRSIKTPVSTKKNICQTGFTNSSSTKNHNTRIRIFRHGGNVFCFNLKNTANQQS